MVLDILNSLGSSSEAGRGSALEKLKKETKNKINVSTLPEDYDLCIPHKHHFTLPSRSLASAER